MDVNGVFRLKDGFLLERIDGEVSVYHPTLTTAVYLNETGALIWELCDGHRTVAEIITILSDQYPGNEAQITDDVKSVISRLLEHHIGELIT